MSSTLIHQMQEAVDVERDKTFAQKHLGIFYKFFQQRICDIEEVKVRRGTADGDCCMQQKEVEIIPSVQMMPEDYGPVMEEKCSKFGGFIMLNLTQSAWSSREFFRNMA